MKYDTVARQRLSWPAPNIEFPKIESLDSSFQVVLRKREVPFVLFNSGDGPRNGNEPSLTFNRRKRFFFSRIQRDYAITIRIFLEVIPREVWQCTESSMQARAQGPDRVDSEPACHQHWCISCVYFIPFLPQNHPQHAFEFAKYLSYRWFYLRKNRACSQSCLSHSSLPRANTTSMCIMWLACALGARTKASNNYYNYVWTYAQ